MADASREREGVKRDVQRIVDIFFVVSLMPIWAPILGLALLAIWLTAGRPVFFTQVRMGLRGSPFRIFKLRTMHDGAAAPENALFEGWTYANDPRVTRVGSWLRRYRVDELPQLINILRGEMSLVGPRPEPLEIAERLGTEIGDYHNRHEVRPGLTGLCQISAVYRDFGTVEKSARKLELDLEYVRRRSVWLDLRIMLGTARVILTGQGMS
jgi:lipopolysaccharide/colanic/teichoic acid biosynthesis glycosyltransferase